MTPEKWEQVAELVEAALALAPAEREVFLGKACHKDSTLRAEVEALLSSYDKAEGFLDGLLEGATALLGDAEAPPGEGAMIGPYRIARELARSYSNLGNVYAVLASKSPGNQRIENWREARSNYQKSLDILSDMRNRGTLPASESGEPEKIAAEIARCDAALKR
jgi:hypothetical protein